MNEQQQMNLAEGFDLDAFVGTSLGTVEAFYRVDLPLGAYVLKGTELTIAEEPREVFVERTGETLTFVEIMAKHEIEDFNRAEGSKYLSADPDNFRKEVSHEVVEEALKTSNVFTKRFSVCVAVNGTPDPERRDRGMGEIKAWLEMSGFENTEASLRDLQTEWPGHVYVGGVTGRRVERDDGTVRVYNDLDMRNIMSMAEATGESDE